MYFLPSGCYTSIAGYLRDYAMTDAGGPLSELHKAAATHMESLDVKLGELAKRPDPEIAQEVRELQKILAELRGFFR